MDAKIFWSLFLGFVFSSAVYIFADIIKEAYTKQKYRRYLKEEMQFNSRTLAGIIDRLQSDRTTITGQGDVWATYYRYLFHTGILNKCADKGYLFDFIINLEDRSLILEFALTIVSIMTRIDSHILAYQQNQTLGAQINSELDFNRRELTRMREGLDRIFR